MKKENSEISKIKVWLEDSKNQKKLKLVALLFVGFVIGLTLKTQANKNVVMGFDDYKALNSDEILIQE